MAQSEKIVLENQKLGNPESEWGLSAPASTNIEGFAEQFSVNIGSQVNFKINTDASNYRVEIYRLGYYDGMGARLVGTIDHHGAEVQPAALRDAQTNMVDAANWHVTDAWTVPNDAVSGVYMAKIIREDGTFGENQIPFVVRDDDSHSDIVFQTSDTTWQAYNTWGNNHLYDGVSTAVSYNRPISLVGSASGDSSYVWSAEYPAIRWLEANGYDVSYISGLDTARSGAELLEHRAFLSVGHDEYWSAEQRANVEAARDAGVNLAFWSGNEMFWKIRWADEIGNLSTLVDSVLTGGTGCCIICIKETLGRMDPSDIWTGTWRDPAGVSQGAIPENALTGTMFTVNNPGSNAAITITYDQAQSWFWDNTAISQLQPGQVHSLSTNYLGYEFDSAVNNGFQPDNLVTLSTTTTPVAQLLVDQGGTYAPGTATHSLTLYKADSGALVFSAGTVYWAWALDSHHPLGANGVNAPTDINVQQAMVNLFAQMGIQPETLQAGLIDAQKTVDQLAPVSTATNVSFDQASSTITVYGRSVDQGGGAIGKTEVSLDGGANWHLATGPAAAWTYTGSWAGVTKILTRATDDSMNMESTGGTSAKLLDFTNYEAANPDVSFSSPLLHYLMFGWKEGRDPNTAFDTELYLQKNPDVAAAGQNPLLHYLSQGQFEGRSIYAAVGNVSEDGFDASYYRLANPDVAAAYSDVRQHWEEYGWSEGRNPNAYFDTAYYLANNSDVAAANIDPLVHYFEYGWQEGRDPSAKFSTNTYLTSNSDVAAAEIDPLTHYLQYGVYEGRDLL
jgi:hypothetical protein